MSRLTKLGNDRFALPGASRFSMVTSDRVFVGTAYRVCVATSVDDGSDPVVWTTYWSTREEAEAEQRSALTLEGLEARAATTWIQRTPTSVTWPYADGSAQWTISAIVEEFETTGARGEARS